MATDKKLNQNTENEELPNEGEIQEDDVENENATLKQNYQEIAKKVLGMENREEYSTTADYVANQVMNNGILGALQGIVISVSAVLSHALHVFIANVIFGQAEHLNFKRAMEEAGGRANLNRETRTMKKNEKDSKDEKSQEKTGKNNNVKDEQESLINEKDDAESSEVSPVSVLIEEINHTDTPEVADYIKEMEDNIEEIIKDSKDLDDVISSAFQYSESIKFFNEFHIIPQIDHNSDRIFLFQNDRENNLEQIPYIKKEDILTGDAQALGAALYRNDKNDNRDQSLLAAAKAVVLAAKLKNEIYSGPLEDARQSMNEKNNDLVCLTYAVADCPNNTSGLIYTALAPETESVQIFYKNQYIGTVDLQEPFELVADKVYDHMIRIDNEFEKKEYTIGDSISFSKESKDAVKIEINGESKVFPLTQEKDMKAIADYIAEKSPEKTSVAQIDAMLIGTKMNPYMEKAVDENGIPLNPFTNNVVERGDLVLKLDDGIPSICEYDISISNAIGMAGCTVEDMKEIAFVHTDGISQELESLEERIKNYIESPKDEPVQEGLVSMNAMVFGAIEKEVTRPFDMAQISDGHNVYKQLQDAALLDGRDLSNLEIIGNESYEHTEDIASGYEDMFREAEETMEQEGMETEQEEER